MDTMYNQRPDDIYVDYTDVIEKLRDGSEVDAEIISTVKSKSQIHRDWMETLYNRYRVLPNGVSIFTRSTPAWQQANNKLNNDYFGEIITLKTGYFAGKPISYGYSKQRVGKRQNNVGGIVGNAFRRLFGKPTGTKIENDGVITEKDYEAITEKINDFVIRNAVADKDAEDTKMAAICGYSARLLYIDPDGEIAVKNIKPFEVVILSDDDITHPEFAFRFLEDSKKTVEFYDATNMAKFQDTGSGYVKVDSKPHMFPGCPLIGIPNNSELMGDAERVLTLIDGCDNTTSDVNSEIEDFRSAYLVAQGGTLDSKDLKQARQDGAFNVDEGTTLSYLTKQIDDSFIEHHLDRLDSKIHCFSQTPNINDVSFAGQASGVALKYKILSLENKCSTFERKFSSALTYMWKLIAGVWEIKGLKIDPYEMVFEFKRNIPLDLQYEAQASSQFKGIISEPTRLGLLSFVDDVDYEMEMMQQEIDESISEPLVEDGDDDEPSGTTAAPDRGTGIISEQSA